MDPWKVILEKLFYNVPYSRLYNVPYSRQTEEARKRISAAMAGIMKAPAKKPNPTYRPLERSCVVTQRWRTPPPCCQ